MKSIKKKLLFVSHENSVNGSSVSLLSLIKGIEKINPNIGITVLIPLKWGRTSQAQKFFSENGVKVSQILYRSNYKEIGIKAPWVKHLHDIWNFLAAGALCQYIKRNKFDIVCSNSSAVDVEARAV